jgi:hypothetical protein
MPRFNADGAYYGASPFEPDLARLHALDSSLDDGYEAMAADVERESEALEWCNSLAVDMAHEAPCTSRIS